MLLNKKFSCIEPIESDNIIQQKSALVAKFAYFPDREKVRMSAGRLKVGSWSFEGILILLIYFLNCQKAFFTKK